METMKDIMRVLRQRRRANITPFFVIMKMMREAVYRN